MKKKSFAVGDRVKTFLGDKGVIDSKCNRFRKEQGWFVHIDHRWLEAYRESELTLVEETK